MKITIDSLKELRMYQIGTGIILVIASIVTKIYQHYLPDLINRYINNPKAFEVMEPMLNLLSVLLVILTVALLICHLLMVLPLFKKHY